MSTDPEDTFDALLRDHFHHELDAQLGRAEARFTRDVARRQPRRPGAPRLTIWTLWAAGAVAASVGIVWGVVARHDEPPPRVTEQAKQSPAATDPIADVSERIPVEQVVAYRTLDEGTVVLGPAGPARRLRRQVVERTQWYDPQNHASIEVTVPREQVVLVEMPSY